MRLLKNILIIIVGIIVAIPILLWFAIRGICTGSWKMLAFICEHQYRELRQLCENGTADELEAFLAAHPGAKEYIVYTRQKWASSIVTTLFRLPTPLAVAGRANNLAVIPVLLAHGASPEVRGLAAKHSPAEEAIGEIEKMRALCGGKTWWLERTENNEALEAGIVKQNLRSIVWNVMRGARLSDVKQLYSKGFLNLPTTMMAFVCRFGIAEKQREKFYSQLKSHPQEELKPLAERRRNRFGQGDIGVSREGDFTEMMRLMEESLQPLPAIDDDTMERLRLSSSLLDRSNMLEMIDNLFSLEQQFALLERFTAKPVSQEERNMTEEAVDLLLCSILKSAGEKE